MKLKKIPYIEMVPILLIAFLLFKVVNSPRIITDIFDYFFALFSNIIWAFAIAYLLNPLMVFLEKKFHMKRIVSLLIIYLGFIGIIVFAVLIITPGLANNISQLVQNIPDYISQSEKWFNSLIDNLEILDANNITTYLQKNISELLQQIGKLLNTSLSIVINNVINLTSTLFKLIFGLLISVYMLYDKEVIIKSLNRMIYAYLDTSHSTSLLRVGRKINNIFKKYIVGKVVDSALVGIICFIGLMIMNAPFALLISLIVGITNLIPLVGAYISVIPAVIITLLISPVKAFWVLAFLATLQQFDGMVLGPKIIGEKVGLSPFLIITSVIVGGGLFGIMGMFLAVPVVAVLKVFLKDNMDQRLKSKHLDL